MAQSISAYSIDTDVTNSTTNTTATIHSSSGWWTPTSPIVTAPANTDVMNQLCRVCGEPAAGFHFGAFTCEGCKSFFGRTYNNLGSISGCKNGGVCVINKKNRTACKACRLQKCLMVGMSKSGSRYGRRSNWFKIHCLLQEQSHHQAQQAHLLKHSTESNSERVLSSLDAANNNTNNNNSNNTVTGASSQSRKIEEPIDPTSAGPPILSPEMLSSGLLMPDPTRFPMWRLPNLFHPTLHHLQFLGTPYFPFQQRFIVPYVNPGESHEISVTSLSISSSESASLRATPSPKTEDKDDAPNNGKHVANLQSLGPEQEEPMDLSKKAFAGENNDLDDESTENGDDEDAEVFSDSDIENVIETDSGPLLDLSWNT